MFCITTPILTKKVMNGATKDALETLFQASSTPLTFGSLITFQITGFGGARQTTPEFFLMEDGETWSWAELSPNNHPHAETIAKALLCLHCDPFLGKTLAELHRKHMCFSIQEKYFVEYLPGLLWVRKFNDDILDRELNLSAKQMLMRNLDPQSPTLWRYGAVVRNPSSAHNTLQSTATLFKSTQWALWRDTLNKACERVQDIAFSQPTEIST